MARLIPKIDVDEIELKPERDVARALIEQLPDECIVYHSYPWLKAYRHDRGRNDTLQEGEADFVIVDPKAGILILEVKGGSIQFDSQSHLWYRNVNSHRKEIKDPFGQARRNTHHLMKQICEYSFPGKSKPPCGFGYAVIFPDCTYSGPTPPGGDNAIILSAPDLPYLDRRIGEILRKWNRSNPPRELSKEDLNGVVKGLSPSFRLLPVLFRQVEEQEEKLFRLTAEQVRLLDFLKDRRRAAINGVAGSGKTLLARAQAERFAEEGAKVLMVCYNKSLADWLRSSLPGKYQKTITVRNFHGLCVDYCKRAGIELFKEKLSDGFWRYEAPERFLEALDVVPERFDAVVVDEGQDFYPEWWLPLELINGARDPAPLYLFYDPAQNLFVEDGLMPTDLGTPFSLPTNCRNTKQIASVCSKIRGVDIAVRKTAPDGVQCKTVQAESQAEQERACKKFLTDWITRGKLDPSQIVILGPHKKAHSSIAQVSSVGKIRITPTLEKWERGEAVLYSSIRAFKGLEADAVIMIDVAKPDFIAHFSTADLYVGCSRAKHLLALICSDDLSETLEGKKKPN